MARRAGVLANATRRLGCRAKPRPGVSFSARREIVFFGRFID
jgi:hypothetical protein